MNSLNGKTALITGASRLKGIGFGIAKRLASMGADLFLHSFTAYDRQLFLNQNPDDLTIKTELETSGCKIEQMDADFLDPCPLLWLWIMR